MAERKYVDLCCHLTIMERRNARTAMFTTEMNMAVVRLAILVSDCCQLPHQGQLRYSFCGEDIACGLRAL